LHQFASKRRALRALVVDVPRAPSDTSLEQSEGERKISERDYTIDPGEEEASDFSMGAQAPPPSVSPDAPPSTNMYEALWSNGPKEAIEFADYTYDQHFGHALPF
jgi:hypothetical protein